MTRVIVNGNPTVEFDTHATHNQLTKFALGKITPSATITYKTNHGGGSLKAEGKLTLESGMTINVGVTGAA